ncbi:hypothetical protein LJB98_04505 [Bacteroidales bacterium OttesenSCG-928-M11]|nr:hypothetical protein [Bacteroidales bacterium OttesenSCG-928-M11]
METKYEWKTFKDYTWKERILGICGPLLALLLMSSGIIYNLLERDKREKKIQEEGVLIECVIEYYYYAMLGRIGKSPSYGYIAIGFYEVDNKKYRMAIDQRNKYQKPLREGTVVQIKYLPEDPKQWLLANREEMKEYLD